MATNKYWKGLEELNSNPDFIQKSQHEFAEKLPVEGLTAEENTGTNRRDFLKFLGFSVTAASLAACETPVYKSIPYVIKPQEITPGVANWYASTYFDGADYASIVVKTREGRPVKIEGNTLSAITNGGTSARVQAAILSLYDSSRLNGPLANKAPATWANVDKDISSRLNAIATKGGAIRLLSSTIISPSTKKVIADFIEKYPTTKHVTYDAVSSSGLIQANGASFGKAVVPSYRFDEAHVVVGIACDFLVNWVSPIEHAKQYGTLRKVGKDRKEMSKHYHFEANLSVTGANADVREPVKVSELGKIALSLYNAVANLVGGSSLASATTSVDKTILKAASDLAANRGKSLVVAGSNDIHVQMLVNGINEMLGNYGKTIDLDTPNYTRQGDDAAFTELVSEMSAGKVSALITYNTNPVYTAPASLKFAEAFSKVDLRISFAERPDETADHANYVCPDHNFLESWNDYNPKKGHYSLSQPTISPLYKTRQAQESLLAWTGNTSSYHSYLQKNWMETIFPMAGSSKGFPEFWNLSLQDGALQANASVIETKTEKKKASPSDKKDDKAENVKPVIAASLAEAAAKVNAIKGGSDGSFELAIYEKAGIGNGTLANNPWLQELPDPISKITWDNYVTMSPVDMDGKYEMMSRQDREASLVNISFNGMTIENIPVIPQPGQAKGTIGIALGYGRDKAGALSTKTGVIGKNIYPWLQVNNETIDYNVLNVTVSEETGSTKIAGTQIHHTLMGRDIVKETVLEEYKIDAKAGNHRELMVTHSGKVPAVDVDLWDEHDKLGHRWGMTIDLNSCIGCGACVVGCTVENNVAVVGKGQVMQTREMHWLRIDRYYSTNWPNEIREAKEQAHEEGVGAVSMYLDMENPAVRNPKVVFQPMLCQHCNHAPCETVCPVIATNHSSEGLNMMTYNRCVGTRYCANNCPYKVRRFNWFNYNENPDFSINPSQDDLGRMVLNPDVVVRSRGVMEKCSMCVQRVQEGKLNAKKAERKLVDGDIKTACQQACPTNAIIFGDLNDNNSAVTKLRVEDERNYFVLEEIGVKPTLSYLTKVRNCEADTMEHVQSNKKAEA